MRWVNKPFTKVFANEVKFAVNDRWKKKERKQPINSSQSREMMKEKICEQVRYIHWFVRNCSFLFKVTEYTNPAKLLTTLKSLEVIVLHSFI